MSSELALLLSFVLLTSIGTYCNAQPTTLDFDFSEDGAALRHVIKNLQLLTEEAKATRLSSQSLQQSVESRFEKIETVLNEVKKSNIADRHFQHQISDRFTQMETSTRITLQEMRESIKSGISRQTSDMQMFITNSTYHQGEQIGPQFSDIMEASQMVVKKEFNEIMKKKHKDTQSFLDTQLTRNLNVTISKLEEALNENNQYYNDELEDVKTEVRVQIKNSEKSIISHVTETMRNSTSEMTNVILVPLKGLHDDSLAAVNSDFKRLSTLVMEGLEDISQQISLSINNSNDVIGNVNQNIAFVGERISHLSENILENSTKLIMSHITETARDLTSQMTGAILVPLENLQNDGLAAVENSRKSLSALVMKESADISQNISINMRQNAQLLLRQGKVDLNETVQNILLNISREVLREIERSGDRSTSEIERTTSPGDTGLNIADTVFQFLRLIQEKQTTLSNTLFSNVSSSITRILQQITDESVRSLERTNEELVNRIRSATGPQNGIVRLVNGTDPMSGRVELYVGGVWGTVCDDGWGSEDAEVVCRQLSFCGGAAFHKARYGRGKENSPIHLDDVACTGVETVLLSCEATAVGSHDCSHGEDAGVKCSSC